MRILYVEDNPQLRESIRVLLESEGRDVVTCETAEEALVLDAPLPFDLLITDLSLPGMSGLELIKQLLVADKDRWIVLCTGYQVEDHPRTYGCNVRALVKPFGIDDLESLVVSVENSVRSKA